MKAKRSTSKLPAVNGYAVLVKNILDELEEMENFIKRRTAISYWRVGRFIDKHLLQNKERADYGQTLYERLAKDVERDVSTLQRTVQFYRAYPIPAERRELNWNHYKSLITVKDASERKKLEEKVVRSNWNAKKLRQYLSIKRELDDEKDDVKPVSQLKVTRGRLNTYRLLEATAEGGPLRLDLGFRVRKDFLTAKSLRLKPGDLVEEDPRHPETFSRTSAAQEELFTYRAAVEKVIDGDTLSVTIGLPFGLTIDQRLRLRGIDCPELDTPEGQKAKRFVQARLRDVDFIIIKTWKDTSDKYDRYLADVLYSLQETNPLKVSQEGRYLNQELLDERLAVVYS